MHGLDSLLGNLGEQAHKTKCEAALFVKQASIFTLLVITAIVSSVACYFFSKYGYADLSIAALIISGIGIAGSAAYWAETFRKNRKKK